MATSISDLTLPSLSQARDMQPQVRTDIRPILVAVGLLLAPDDFQMVLDADNTSKSTDFSSLLSVFTKTHYHFLKAFPFCKIVGIA